MDKKNISREEKYEMIVRRELPEFTQEELERNLNNEKRGQSKPKVVQRDP